METRSNHSWVPYEDTESIDVAPRLAERCDSVGSFDVRQFRTTSFGKLLRALPVPALLIDSTHRLVFANQACDKICPEYESLVGQSVAFLCSEPDSLETIKSLMDTVFSTRKPQGCEAAGNRKTRIWGRCSFRSVRS